MRAKLKEAKRKRLLKSLKFLIQLNLFSIPLFLYWLLIPTSGLEVITTNAVSFILRALHFTNFKSFDTSILLKLNEKESATLIIDKNCVGMNMMLAFLALCFASDVRLKEKAISLFFLPLIYLANLLRIVLLMCFLSIFGLDKFAVLHFLFFSIFSPLCVLLFWLLWLKFKTRLLPQL